MNQKPERLLTYTDVQEKLRMSRTAVWQLIKDGKLKEPLYIGRTRRFRESYIEAWIDALAREDSPSGDSGSADDGNPAAGAAGA